MLVRVAICEGVRVALMSFSVVGVVVAAHG